MASELNVVCELNSSIIFNPYSSAFGDHGPDGRSVAISVDRN